ncbi:2-amino-4-hydroxy-6-hydroxymethyldihydropteridine diphosphokinase [Proteiniborus sp. MB09-C3]|uniref:2-amino-4-hydroxy-6- hydroxymethyldihydropteridine diphosphokinase n=1 Tax=Proteiniborus sp. MB09-C3 TaxID=3050072 RepID=UPI0025576FA6|nr:2-amino-4-hydroxy-6-hydroxymethyldihydropteridine diphosphokinase [Proteiniborus sp. MB09-C3]WIV13360.1 2-amino-4-hydroxy-6-hydroxymethyldihydropteridine diphosphokinase [Proteiniborus sp. MB09-C3]
MNKIYLGIGGNIGDTKGNLDRAVELLKEKVNISRQSSYYETEPVGYKEQNWFLNIVIEGETDLTPEELLSFTQSIERKMKRVKTIRFGPRIIDVDILLYEQVKLDTKDLIIPHPRMFERAFVMVPLYEIAPSLVIEDIKIEDILNKLEGEEIHKKDDLNEES